MRSVKPQVHLSSKYPAPDTGLKDMSKKYHKKIHKKQGRSPRKLSKLSAISVSDF